MTVSTPNLSIFIIIAVVVIISTVAKPRSTSSRCHYNIILHEMDPSRCPSIARRPVDGYVRQDVMMADEPRSEDTITRDDLSNEVNSNVTGHLNRGERLENRILEEAVLNRELRLDLEQQKTVVEELDGRFLEFVNDANLVEEQVRDLSEKLTRQRDTLVSMERKLTELVLDMAEVKYRFEVQDKNATEAEEKVVPVENLPSVRMCAAPEGVQFYKDCEEVYLRGNRESGIYHVKSIYSSCPIPVYCDMDTPPSGWLLIQRRRNGDVDFNHNWKGYREGFGDISGDFWLGNDNIFLLTNQRNYQLRVDLWDFYGSRVYAEYRYFKVEGERDLYRLHVSNHSGTAPDALDTHNGKYFSAPDRDNDAYRNYHCAKDWTAGWWFSNCWYGFLNGAYHNTSSVRYKGIAWNSWKNEQLKWAEMKIRPTY